MLSGLADHTPLPAVANSELTTEEACMLSELASQLQGKETSAWAPKTCAGQRECGIHTAGSRLQACSPMADTRYAKARAARHAPAALESPGAA